MKKILALVCVVLFLALGSRAQSPSAFPYAKPVPNDTATGTTQFTLTKINSSGNAVIMSSADVNGFSGVCVSNCGTSGTAWIVFAGLVPLKVENTATVNHYVTIGSTTGGDGHDTGSTSYPGSGAVVGRIQSGASSGSIAMVDIFGPEVIASSPAAPTITVANAGSTGTTSNTLTKLTGAPSTAVIAATSDTKGVVGIVTSGSGTTGNAVIQIAGTVNCVFDGTTTAGDYVQISTSTGGDCHDSGPNYPTTGQAIGRVLSTNGSAGTYNIDLFPSEIQAASGGSSGQPLLNTGIVRSVLPVRSGNFSQLGEAINSTGTSSDGAPTTTAPAYDDWNTAAAFTTACATGCVGYSGSSLYITGVSGTVYQVQEDWPTNIGTNTGRYWVALMNNNLTALGATDTPGTAGYQGVGVRYSTIAGDTHPMCYSFNGSTQTAVTPSPAITPSQYNKFEFDDNGASWTVKVNGTSVCTLSSTLPTSGTNVLFITVAVANTANRIDNYFYGFQEIGQ
jgi:hypothetical protein